jgi:hypothetical protein
LKVKSRLLGSHVTLKALPKEISNSLERRINKRCLHHQCLWKQRGLNWLKRRRPGITPAKKRLSWFIHQFEAFHSVG